MLGRMATGVHATLAERCRVMVEPAYQVSMLLWSCHLNVSLQLQVLFTAVLDQSICKAVSGMSWIRCHCRNLLS